MPIPRLVISGLSGGAGKTMLSLGLARAFANAGLAVRAFKKGPDYIDAAWLALAARSNQNTLDPYFLPADRLTAHFRAGAKGCDLALVEGNRGLFDGLDLDGSCSTAELSRVLKAPVLLVLDCTKMTRTAAALVKGCKDFEPDLNLGGVILNRTGNARHQALVRAAVEQLAGVPVLGVLPRRAEPFIIERHMGLAGLDDEAHQARAEAMLDALAAFTAEHVDLIAIQTLARNAPDLPHAAGAAEEIGTGNADKHAVDNAGAEEKTEEIATGNRDAAENAGAKRAALHPPQTSRPRIGLARDAAFWFYYRENLEALERAGAELVPLSLLADAPWPDLDGLYLGGGLPELYAEALSANVACRARVAGLCRAGLPVYAECGGFMYLAERLVVKGVSHPMAGVLPYGVEFCARPQGLGYVEAEVRAENPFHPAGTRFRGHEFHFSRLLPGDGGEENFILRLFKGQGMAQEPEGLRLDGLLRGNTFASYMHIFAPAVPHWAERFVALCRKA